MKKLIFLILLTVAVSVNGAQWTMGPMKNINGEYFLPGGGIELVLDVVYSEELGNFLALLKSKDNSLVVASSSDGSKWEVISSQSWTWGYSEGKACDGNGALYLLIGNGIFRWDHATWTRSRVLSASGNLDSIAMKLGTVVVAGWSSGLVYYSTNGINYQQGISDVPLEDVAATSTGFMAMRTANTTNRTLLSSSDGSYFGITSTLPSNIISSQFIGDLGDLVLLAHWNSTKLGVYLLGPSGTYLNYGLFNDMGTSLTGNWPVRGHITSKGGVLTTLTGGILEILRVGESITFTKREDAALKLKWRGVASGNGVTILITETGVMGVSNLDFSANDGDLDNDGILDAYENSSEIYVSPVNTGTTPTVADTDGDGFLDGFEVASGTNPNHAASQPNPQNANIKPAVEFIFPSTIGGYYWIETSDDLQNWSIIEQRIPGNGSTISRFYPAGESTRKFYRAIKY